MLEKEPVPALHQTGHNSGVTHSFAAFLGIMLARGAKPAKKVGKVGAAVGFGAFALLGAVLGGLLFGGVGAIGGFALGDAAGRRYRPLPAGTAPAEPARLARPA